MKKALYIHGLASGSKSKTGRLLKQYFTEYEWTLAEVNHHCEESLQILTSLIEDLQPDLVCGTSLGGYYIVCLADKIKGQMILANPALNPSKDIRQFVGENRYFCKRLDKEKTFILTNEDCDNMRSLEFVKKQIEQHKDKMHVFYSDHDEVLGFDYYPLYLELFSDRATKTTQMGHSMTEEFVAGDLTRFISQGCRIDLSLTE